MRNAIVRASSLLLFVGLVAAGCASSGESSGSDRNMITSEEMAEISGNLYEVVDRLRPLWLQTRGAVSTSGATAQVLVYMNRSYVGGVEELRSFNPANVVRLRYLTGSRAAATLTGYPSTISVAGAIILETSGRDD